MSDPLVIEVALAAKVDADRARLAAALDALADGSFPICADIEKRQQSARPDLKIQSANGDMALPRFE